MPPARSIATWIGAAAAVLVPSLGYAQVYKCAGEKGVPVYQEMPCSPGKELRNFQTDPPEITILPARRPPGNPADVIREVPPKNGKADKDAKPAKPSNAASAAERMHLRLGSPDVTVGGKGTPSPRWSYLPAPGDPETTTTLVFNKGVVVDIERKIVKK
jgi:hypothetical protein